MAKELRKPVWERLVEVFGDRARNNKVERLVYSHDMGVLPEQVRKLINCLPDAVVQPISVDEVVTLSRLAGTEGVPVVPRGAGTSGFGGAVPARGGIVVDFSRMRRVLEIDAENMTAKVEPGVIWNDLQKELKQRGLALRIYPSSATSSTVAGWVAQGGSGYGSYLYGTCGDNIEAVEVVLPSGKLATISGHDLEKVYGLCGITGMIVAVTVKVRKDDEEFPLLAAFDSLEDAVRAMAAIKRRKLPLWSVSMSLPGFTRLKQKATGHTLLPEDKYLVSMVILDSQRDMGYNPLFNIVETCGGKMMPSNLAREEWDERFYPLRFKKLGPTLVASEVIIPISSLPAFIRDIEARYKGEFVFEGTMVNDEEIAVLGFMLSDERKLGFPLAYANSLDVIERAENYGGRVFALGMYFADRAKQVMGDILLQKVWQYKQKIDPAGIMNPGKVIPAGLDKNAPTKLLASAMKVADAGKGLIGLAGKLLLKLEGNKFESPLNEHITEDTFACALCGYCRTTCTVFDANPWESISPRGKYFLLNQYIKGNIALDEEVAGALFTCTTCKKCDLVCQIKAHNAHNWMSLRPCFHANGLENLGLAAIRENVLKTGNFWGLSPEQRLAWLKVKTPAKGKIAYWGGCWASIVMDNMADNITRIFGKIGLEFVHFGERETCCGLYLALGGYQEDFVAQVKRNLEMFKEAGIETMVFSCPGCYATFTENYPVIAAELGMECNIRFVHARYS